jgi:hypothetical protein
VELGNYACFLVFSVCSQVDLGASAPLVGGVASLSRGGFMLSRQNLFITFSGKYPHDLIGKISDINITQLCDIDLVNHQQDVDFF